MTVTTKDFAEREAIIARNDEWMRGKITHMYDYLDFDTDRAVARAKFLKEMNKRSTLADIGEELDKLVIDSKAANWEHYNITEHWNAQPERPKQDYTSEDFKWSGKLLK